MNLNDRLKRISVVVKYRNALNIKYYIRQLVSWFVIVYLNFKLEIYTEYIGVHQEKSKMKFN